MREFFGFGTGEYEYGRPADGFMSWQHLVMVSVFLTVGIALAIILGRHYRNKDYKVKNMVLVWAAILIDAFEIVKIIIGSVHTPDFWHISLPLFLCSIQLITIPLAAFCKGRLKEASLDFVLIFGILGGALGTVAAAQNYNAYPAFSWPNFVSATTHTISAFASVYIAVSGMVSMKKKNIFISYSILFGFGIAAYVANILLDYNYMFLMAGDGTPYDIFYNLVGGSPVFYPIIVMGLFLVYITGFYGVYMLIDKKRCAHAQTEEIKIEKEPELIEA